MEHRPKEHKAKKLNLSIYRPLFVLVCIAILAAIALTLGLKTNSLTVQNSSFHIGMSLFMGFFLCIFAMFKLFDPKGFVEGFQKYDLLAKKSQLYGYFYPYIELFLGLGLLSAMLPLVFYALTILIMAVSAIGVIKALKAGLEVRCACMGTVLNVPLSTVTLTEDILMGLMALIMLIQSI